MKSTTQQILNLIQSDNFVNLSTLKEKVVSYGWDNPEYQEMSFDESIAELESINNLIENSIKSKNNIFENVFVYQERNNILSVLQSLNSNISNIKDNHNQLHDFILHVQELKAINNRSFLENKINGYPNYQLKLKEVNYLKLKYGGLILALDKAEKLKKEYDNILSSLSEKDQVAINYLDSITKLANNVESLQKDINSRHENIKTLNSNIVQYHAEANQNKQSILTFFGKIDEYENKIKSGLDTLNEDIKTANLKMDKVINKNNNDTANIISENNKLQQNIYDILGKAIGTNLYKTFSQKSNWMLGQSVFWLVALIISILFLADSGKYIFESLKPAFEKGEIKDLTLTFYFRLTLMLPSIYAVYFAASEFRNSSKIKEEYDFKSSIAVTLEHFRDLVEKAEKDVDKQFLINSIKKIFESPTEKVFEKKMNQKELNSRAKDIVSDVAEITGNIANKILPK